MHNRLVGTSRESSARAVETVIEVIEVNLGDSRRSPAATRSSRVLADWAAGLACVVAATLFLVAPYATVIRLRQSFSGVSLSTSWNGWGKFTAPRSASVQVDPYVGPRYGVLLWGCAALLVGAACLVLHHRSARRGQGRLIGFAGATAGLGVTVTAYTVGRSYTTSASAHAVVTAGLGLWLSAVASVIGLLPACVAAAQAARSISDIGSD
jgi:hypothetical protein